MILATPKGLVRSTDNGVNWEIRNGGLGLKSWNWQNSYKTPVPYGLGDYLSYHWCFTDDDKKLYKSIGDLGHWVATGAPFTTSYETLVTSDSRFYRVEGFGNSTPLNYYETFDNGTTWTLTGSLPSTHQLPTAIGDWGDC